MDTGSPVLAELKTGAQHIPYIFPKYKCGLTCETEATLCERGMHVE